MAAGFALGEKRGPWKRGTKDILFSTHALLPTRACRSQRLEFRIVCFVEDSFSIGNGIDISRKLIDIRVMSTREFA